MGKALFPYGDVISGAFLAGLGTFILIEARSWTYAGPEGPGPGFFPTWYGVAMIGLSLALVVKPFFSSSREEAVRIDRAAAARALGTWAAFAVAVALLKPLGFIVSFGLLTFFIVAVIFRRSAASAALTAVGVAVAFQLVFPVALSVALPTGWLGF